MFDRWKLQDFAPGEGAARHAFAEQFDTSGWIDISAPGDVHQALMEVGRIADPFYDRNEDTCAWMEEREWWYRLRMESKEPPLRSDERLLLVFQGLDTFVTLWLNGELLGEHANMFSEAVFDVSRRWHTNGSNTLALCFHPPLKQVEDTSFETWGRNPARVLMRKAQFGYGWDWGPRLPTIGIWRPVELRRERYACIQGIHFSTLDIDTQNNKALVAVEAEVERFGGDQAVTLSLALLAPDTAGGT
ncbi:MAG TPA: glycoside hydrolase family 2 protein, partial [Ktedonobacteraceae bacterium]|nr:glycoside hydrolase family 2 protein [Ktedonobacteraceae bacterium]